MHLPFLIVILSTAVSASNLQSMNWQDAQSLRELNELFDGQATNCEALGFKKHANSSEATMARKIEAFLLLQDDPKQILSEWGTALESIDESPEEWGPNSPEQKMFNAALAAVRDPQIRPAAQAAYVDAFLEDDLRTLASCNTGAKDSFISMHYWSGSGDLTGRERVATAAFNAVVSEMEDNGR